MSNEVVKYHNDLNAVSMSGWTSAEMNIFFGIVAKVYNQGTKEVVLNVDDLKEITDTKNNKNPKRWDEAVESVAGKIATLRYTYRDADSIEIMNLFAKFKIDLKSKELKVSITDYFQYIVNQLSSQFTSWELAEFTSLKSSYSKTMYRLLKQWRTVGKKRFKLDEFRVLFDVPESYVTGMIKKRIIDNSINELSPYFKGLTCKVLKENRKGTPVVGYEFTWEPEQTNKFNPNKFKKVKKQDVKPYWLNEPSSDSNSNNVEVNDIEKIKKDIEQLFS